MVEKFLVVRDGAASHDHFDVDFERGAFGFADFIDFVKSLDLKQIITLLNSDERSNSPKLSYVEFSKFVDVLVQEVLPREKMSDLLGDKSLKDLPLVALLKKCRIVYSGNNVAPLKELYLALDGNEKRQKLFIWLGRFKSTYQLFHMLDTSHQKQLLTCFEHVNNLDKLKKQLVDANIVYALYSSSSYSFFPLSCPLFHFLCC